jgi:hypothetical protein
VVVGEGTVAVKTRLCQVAKGVVGVIGFEMAQPDVSSLSSTNSKLPPVLRRATSLLADSPLKSQKSSRQVVVDIRAYSVKRVTDFDR